ncbi:N-acetylmuramoyl-L-alanine amidase [Lysobacter solisilvae]|uniref:Serine protease n=1 Tax=Agrilutibacter solisilvae TaxID=2763317 RepID=A0A975AR72_9GAMM|nr:N-acetylmuramoyl-L-alanine amidase [Lysobacter solisilvae]
MHALTATSPDYPGASRFAPAHSNNFRVGRRRNAAVDRIVIHITAGGPNINGTISWFQNGSRVTSKGKPNRSSAHYIVGRDGEVVQMVRNADTAHHASAVNPRSIGIEHNANKPSRGNARDLPPTDPQYEASARLVAWLCQQYALPIDREHIVGHFEASPRDNHDCPSDYWDWDRYMACVQLAATQLASGQGVRSLAMPVPRRAVSRGLEIISPFYDPADPSTALSCQDNAFSLAREEWFVGVPNTSIFPHSAICQLNMTAPDGSQYSGTGFYVGRNRILTCAHNLHGMSRCEIIPGRNGAGNRPFGSATVQSASWRIAPRYSGSGDWDNDLAVIDNVPIAAPGGACFEFLNASPSDRLPIVVCGYSAASRTVPELDYIIDGDKQHLHGGYVSSAPTADTIDYPILSLMGASGSPVYTLSRASGTLKAMICAVHVSGEPAAQGLNRGCFITPTKIDWIEGRATTFSLGVTGRGLSQEVDDDSQRGIEGPIPDDSARAQSLAAVGRALTAPSAEYPQASRFVPADSGNFRASSSARAIERIVIHITDGGANINGTIGWFQNPAAQVSAHYVIGQDGEVVQMVRHNDVAWHARSANRTSIGIEHVANTRGLVPTTAQLCASAALVNWLCDTFGIPADRAHIQGHSEADTATTHTGCPNAVWDWNHYMSLVSSRSCHAPDAARAQALSTRALEIPLDPGIGGMSIGYEALAPGDIIVSTARHAVSFAIRAGTLSAISHAMIYAGNGNVIEAVGDGVHEVPLATAIGDAILAVAYRDPRVDAARAQAMVDFARAQVGQPYNYTGVARIGHRILFPLQARLLDAIASITGADTTTARSFYCSELVFAAFEAAGIPLVAAAAGDSTPQDVVALTRGSLGYVGHLKARDEFLGIALGLSAQALSGGSDYPVHLIPQPNKDACWAASMAMLLSFRRNQSLTPETLARDVGASLATCYNWDLLEAVRDRYGFQILRQPDNASIYHSPQQWADWLASYGPLWVVIVGAPHAVVLAGIRGNLADPASVQVKILNPWDTRVGFDADPVEFHPRNNGYEDWLGFNQFASDFGNMAEPNYGNWRVLHLPAVAASSQSLGHGGGYALKRAPAALSLDLGGPLTGQPQEPIEPTRIAGTRMHTVRGSAGASRWALDQVEGLKSPATPNLTVGSAATGEVTVELNDWPAIDGAPCPLPLTLSFRASQGSVGDVRIRAGLPANLAYGVEATARIEDHEDLGGVAAIRVTVDYRFSGLAQGNPAARIRLRLLGDGRFERENGWVDAGGIRQAA